MSEGRSRPGPGDPWIWIPARTVWSRVRGVSVRVSIGTIIGPSIRGNRVGDDRVGVFSSLVRKTFDRLVKKRGDVSFWWRPTITHFGCYWALFRDDVSFDRVTAREVFAAVRARMRLFDSSDVSGLMTLEI